MMDLLLHDGPAPAARRVGTATLMLPDPAATAALGRRLARQLRRGDLVALSGPLGAGKSDLARAMIRAVLAAPEAEVPSPTFTLVQTYTPADPAAPAIWHCDLYRLDDPEEVAALALDEALGEAALLVEWPDRLGSRLPADRLDLGLAPAPDGGRIARLAGHGDWAVRVTDLIEAT